MQKIMTESLQGYGSWLKEALLRTGLTIRNCADACHCSDTFVYQTFKELDRSSTANEVLSHLVVKTIIKIHCVWKINSVFPCMPALGM